MKKIFLFLLLIASSYWVSAQPDNVETMQANARTFMQSGDYTNAILILQKALEKEPKNLALEKDLAMSYYLKRDYKQALTEVEKLIDRDDADVVSYQIAGNVYKALEEVKDCEKMYKKALKKFPNSGPLYSEYGELLFSAKDYSAIDKWEKGIDVDPAYSGNYYNAALYYFYTKDKVWSLIYGEIFVNMESLSPRGAAMKQQLLEAYKEKLFTKIDDKENEADNGVFAKAFLSTMEKLSGLASKGITVESLSMIRTRFILDWFANYAEKYPFKLFDYQKQLLSQGMFDAYNQWLFGTTENLAAYDNWTKTHSEEYNKFHNFQKNSIFRMPKGQHYRVF